MAVMVSVTAICQTGTGVLGVGTTEADLGGGIVVFDPAQHASTTMIIPLTDAGMFTIGSWTQTDVAVDVIGVFKAPTRTWRYEYDTTGMRTAKQLDNTTGTGAEWRKEHTWTASGGLPLLLAEHQGTQSAYVIYGPGGTPIYQINTTGDVQYLHQDHQGSTRLTTNPNGTTRNTITYNAHGEITANTNWWLEQPLNGYTGQYHDPETGYIYLRARHYDPTTGQFATLDPLVAMTEEPYGYVGGNPVNGRDPSGLCGSSASSGRSAECKEKWEKLDKQINRDKHAVADRGGTHGIRFRTRDFFMYGMKWLTDNGGRSWDTRQRQYKSSQRAIKSLKDYVNSPKNGCGPRGPGDVILLAQAEYWLGQSAPTPEDVLQAAFGKHWYQDFPWVISRRVQHGPQRLQPQQQPLSCRAG